MKLKGNYWRSLRLSTPCSLGHLSVNFCVSVYVCVSLLKCVWVCQCNIVFVRVCVSVSVCVKEREREREISKGRSMPVSFGDGWSLGSKSTRFLLMLLLQGPFQFSPISLFFNVTLASLSYFRHSPWKVVVQLKEISITGFPRYSRGLRSFKNIYPRIPKPLF